MNEPIFEVGNIATIDGNTYRVLNIYGDTVSLCKINTNKLEIIEMKLSAILNLINQRLLVISKDDDHIVFDLNSLSENIQERYKKLKKVMNEVIKAYWPDIQRLCGKSPKPELYAILENNNIPSSTFWRVCVRYFQSGMRDSSLVDKKAFREVKGPYQYNKRAGRKTVYSSEKEVIDRQKMEEYFEEAIKEYRESRAITLKDAYDRMNLVHYTKTEIVNGIPTLSLIEESKRPTRRQFYYWAGKRLSKQEKDIIKTSYQEHRNDKRLLTGDSLDGVYGPGDMIEIDACEADISLVSSFETNRTVGRPVVYMMIDVYSRVILAVSISFDNNSVAAITNLFINLADDKKEFCARYGVNFDDERIWPSRIIPRRIRIDRGPEFKSKRFNQICVDLGIEKDLVPGASGSMKGIVEQSFHQMHRSINPHVEGKGLIEKRYDSHHHEEASLTIYEYTKMVLQFVLTHNQKYFKDYPITPDMAKKGIQLIPALLWEYGIKKYSAPRPITSTEQYLYNLMTPVKASITRRGIKYKGLYYYSAADSQLNNLMFKAGTHKIPFEVRLDVRDISFVYYIRDEQLIKVPLNEKITGNADFKHYTMKEYEDYLIAKKKMDATGEVMNQNMDAYTYAVNEMIANSTKSVTSDSLHMREAREKEKQKVSRQHAIDYLLPESTDVINTDIVNTKKQESVKEAGNNRPLKEYSSFDDALADMWENE